MASWLAVVVEADTDSSRRAIRCILPQPDCSRSCVPGANRRHKATNEPEYAMTPTTTAKLRALVREWRNDRLEILDCLDHWKERKTHTDADLDEASAKVIQTHVDQLEAILNETKEEHES